jgi:thioredoxin 1
MQAPIMDELAVKLEGRATVGKVNVDENPNTASKFGITGIPTSILFKDGAEAQRFVGVQSEEVLKKAVEDQIGS